MPDAPLLPPVAITWFATYLAHSTVLILLVLLVTRIARSAAARETLWRAALLGGLLTATLQIGLAPSPWTVDLPIASATERAATQPVTEVPRSVVKPPPADETGVAESAPVPVAAPPVEETARPWPDPATVLDRLILAGLAIGAWLALRRLRARRRLRCVLSRGTEITAGPLREMLDDLLARAGSRRRVRLRRVPGLAGPLALGILRAAIHLPERVEQDLDRARQRALLAHELAHALRRDAVWLVLVRTVCAVLVLQPLNRLVARRLHETAELICDERAAELTGRPRDLVACLAQVAGWLVDGPRGLPAPAMASRGSLLRRRVRRLLDRPVTSRRNLSARPLALGLLVVVGLLAPPVTTLGASSSPDSLESTRPLAEPGPAASSEDALHRLGAEMAALEGEMADLVEALERFEGRPDVDARVARLTRRLATMRGRREIVNPNPRGR